MTEAITPESISSLAADPARFEEQREALRRYCFAILRNEADAEDAVQFTLERALRYGTARTDHKRWLLAIARNVCRDMLTSRSSATEPLDEWAPCPRPSPEQVVTERAVLNLALGTLTPTERRTVGASWLADASSYDAARSVGMAHQTVRVHLSRARRKMADYLDSLERATAGMLPWLLDAHQRLTRRFAALTDRDPAWADRLVALAAPPVALALTVASLTALETQGTRAAAPARLTSVSPLAAQPASQPTAAAVRGAAATQQEAAGVRQALVPALSPGRTQDAYVTDVQPSPSYAQDHTIFAAADDSACSGRIACGELFVSRDAGHSWTNLETLGLQPQAQLLLPASSYAAGIFYAFGPSGLQITRDGGRTFATMIQDLPGYAGLLPPGQAGYVSVSNVDIWSFAAAPAPGLQSAFPLGAVAVGSAVAVPASGGWTLLQPVQVASGPEEVLACSPTGCRVLSNLPWASASTQLVASSGGTLIAAVNAHRLAVSRDGGASFQEVPVPASMVDVAITGPRSMVAVDGASVLYSRDAGLTWTSTSVSGGQPWFVRSTPTGQLVLELVRPSPSGDAQLLSGYACSASGAAWAAC